MNGGREAGAGAGAGAGMLLLFFSGLVAAASPPLLFSPSAFASDHEQMLNRFKVYVYPLQPTHSRFDFRASAFGGLNATAEQVFFRSLWESGFVTNNAEEADLFFLPVSVSAMAASLNVSVGRNMMMYVQRLRDAYPYWQRTLGADHVLVSCRGMKRDFARNVLELQKNSILLACTEFFDFGADWEFYPHKDLVMPAYKPRPLGFENAGFGGEDRPYLAFLLDSPGALPDAFDVLMEDAAFVSDLQKSDVFTQKMLSLSRFCVTFGHTGVGANVVEGMRLGCVPVIISSGYLFGLPFQDIVDWQQFCLVVSLNQMSRLKSVLVNVPEDKYQGMQDAARAASSYLEWQSHPRPYDAFHLLMHELWLRRHTIRYKRRGAY